MSETTQLSIRLSKEKKIKIDRCVSRYNEAVGMGRISLSRFIELAIDDLVDKFERTKRITIKFEE